MDLEEIKKIELNILIEINKLCKKYDIEYFLICGTLLGSIRHQGFIPWDDDIDIIMKRSQYEKFKIICENELPEHLKLSYIDDKDYPYVFPKIYDKRYRIKEKTLAHLNYSLGLYIDVFILDNTSENKFVRYINAKVDYFLYCLTRLYNKPLEQIPKSLRLIRKLFMTFIKKSDIISVKEKLLKRYKFQSTYFYRSDFYNEKAFLKSEYFNHCKYNLFENNLFPIPCGWTELLSFEYGDYMQLPPIESRISNHDFIMLDNQNSSTKEDE